MDNPITKTKSIEELIPKYSKGNQWIVANGTLETGYQFYGVFDLSEHAVNWGHNHLEGDFDVIPLTDYKDVP